MYEISNTNATTLVLLRKNMFALFANRKNPRNRNDVNSSI
jgi:hypothetical protein